MSDADPAGFQVNFNMTQTANNAISMFVNKANMDSKLRLNKSQDTNLITQTVTAVSGALSQLLTSFGGVIADQMNEKVLSKVADKLNTFIIPAKSLCAKACNSPH